MPNFAETKNIAAHMSARNAGGNGYPFGSIIEELYTVDGRPIDWVHGDQMPTPLSYNIFGNLTGFDD